MPDGSSSAAPVITPGPIAFNSLLVQRNGELAGKRVRALASANQILIRSRPEWCGVYERIASTEQ